MAKKFPAMTPEHIEFIQRQKIFFVGSSPLSAEHRVNVTPKGYDCLRVLGESRVAYLDASGSGNDTSANLMENGRITLMFCSFETNPLIMRLYGKGRVILPGEEGWDELIPLFPWIPGGRQIIEATIDLVQTSCGFGVPFFEYKGERETLAKSGAKKEENGMEAYWVEKNAVSIDGLPTPLGLRLGNKADE